MATSPVSLAMRAAAYQRWVRSHRLSLPATRDMLSVSDEVATPPTTHSEAMTP
ncbi:MAG: hypothetical protein JNL30_09450 [Rubrivivax sp.]|nr:hypothetical protein [Rubrivivax sp.]